MAEFQDIYQRYAQDVYRFALYLSGNRGIGRGHHLRDLRPAMGFG